MSDQNVTPKSSNGLVKFAVDAADPKANKFGIVNGRGELVTTQYLARYIQCWCRQENGYVKNRKENFAYFMSNAFLSTCIGMTASQVGKKASVDARWGIAKKAQPADAPLPIDPALQIEPTFETIVAGEPVEEVSAPADQLISEPAYEKPLSKKEAARRARAQLAIATLEAQKNALKPTADEPATKDAIAAIDREIEIINGANV